MQTPTNKWPFNVVLRTPNRSANQPVANDAPVMAR